MLRLSSNSNAQPFSCYNLHEANTAVQTFTTESGNLFKLVVCLDLTLIEMKAKIMTSRGGLKGLKVEWSGLGQAVGVLRNAIGNFPGYNSCVFLINQFLNQPEHFFPPNLIDFFGDLHHYTLQEYMSVRLSPLAFKIKLVQIMVDWQTYENSKECEGGIDNMSNNYIALIVALGSELLRNRALNSNQAELIENFVTNWASTAIPNIFE